MADPPPAGGAVSSALNRERGVREFCAHPPKRQALSCFRNAEIPGARGASIDFVLARAEDRWIEPEKTKAIAALEKAIALNPNWAEPHALFAALVLNPAKKLQELRRPNHWITRCLTAWLDP